MGECVWTVETYALHNEAMRVAEEKFQTERDKRYTEGNELRAMALKIKETADANALELASESQTYKEARNDAMREQNLKETGVYATRDDLTVVVETFKKALEPIEDYISGQKGVVTGSQLTVGKIFGMIAAIGTIMGIITGIIVLIA